MQASCSPVCKLGRTEYSFTYGSTDCVPSLRPLRCQPVAQSKDSEVNQSELAREVLALQTLPYEQRVKAMVSWLKRACALGPKQYKECVKLSVLFLSKGGSHVRYPAATCYPVVAMHPICCCMLPCGCKISQLLDAINILEGLELFGRVTQGKIFQESKGTF
jgi:hypothetical protein